MVKYSCERCGKEFTQKSHYDAHKRRKTPCVNNMDKIKQLVDTAVNEKLRELGVTKVAKNIWNNKANIETRKKRLTSFILFTPAVHKIINSFCLSNFKIETTNERRKEIGINFVIMFVTFKSENRR